MVKSKTYSRETYYLTWELWEQYYLKSGFNFRLEITQTLTHLHDFKKYNFFEACLNLLTLKVRGEGQLARTYEYVILLHKNTNR